MIVDSITFFALVEEQLTEGHSTRITLKGTSMLPTLREGDSLTLTPLEGDPVVGDVVLFRYQGIHLLHRIVAVDGRHYRMQGDNCYNSEEVEREAIVARLITVGRPDGTLVATDSKQWKRLSRRSLLRKKIRNIAIRWLGRDGRKRLRPWYFALLVILMWAPLNGLGVPLDNYIFGLRLDHLLHGSVYLPCALFLKDLFARRSLLTAGFAAAGIGLLTEGVQYLLPWRGFDVNDLLANVLGATLGCLLILLVAKRFWHYKSAL